MSCDTNHMTQKRRNRSGRAGRLGQTMLQSVRAARRCSTHAAEHVSAMSLAESIIIVVRIEAQVSDVVVRSRCAEAISCRKPWSARPLYDAAATR